MFDLMRFERWARAPSIRLVSVDLFDTLLLRGTRPELVRFQDISVQWHQTLIARSLSSPGVDALYQCRLFEHKAAYDRIKAQGGRCEVRHEAILGNIAQRLGLSEMVVPILAATEIDYEKRVIAVNRGLTALLISLRREKPVVFTSDMYLSRGALTDILVAHVPELADLPLFVSSDLGLTKRHGTIFPHLADTCSLTPRDILHVGDNLVSDVTQPRAAGLSAMLLSRSLGWRMLHEFRHRRVKSQLIRKAAPMSDAQGNQGR